MSPGIMADKVWWYLIRHYPFMVFLVLISDQRQMRD